MACSSVNIMDRHPVGKVEKALPRFIVVVSSSAAVL